MRSVIGLGIFLSIFGLTLLVGGTMKEVQTIRERISEEYPDVDLLFMTEVEYDVAIIGVSEMCQGTNNHHHVVYDWDKVIEVNMKMGMTEEEAIEHFGYNQGDAYVGEHTPIYVKRSNIGE